MIRITIPTKLLQTTGEDAKQAMSQQAVTTAIEEVVELIGDTPTGTTLPAIEIVNDLTTGGVDKALSAEQGKQLETGKMNKLSPMPYAALIPNVDTDALQTLVRLGFQLHNRDFSGVNMTSVNLSFGSFIGSYFNKLNFTGALLQRSDFSYCLLPGVNFNNVNAAFANFSNATIRISTCIGSMWNYANFTNANLNNSNFNGCVMPYVTLSGAKLSGVNFYSSNGIETLGSDINTALANVDKNPLGDGAVWSLTWADDYVWFCNPSNGNFYQ